MTGDFSLPSVVKRFQYSPPTARELYELGVRNSGTSVSGDDTIRAVVKQDVFVRDRNRQIDATAMKNVKMLDATGRLRDVKLLHFENDTTQGLLASYGVIYANVRKIAAPAFTGHRDKSTFAENGFRVLSLFHEIGVLEEIDEKLPGMRINVDAIMTHALASACKDAAGKYLIVLGLVSADGKSLQGRDRAGKRSAWALSIS